MKFIIDDGIMKIARLRQIFASELGKIGLYWLSKGFNNVITSNLQSLEDNVQDKKDLPQNLSVQKTHKKAWLEFSKSDIVNNGGNPEPEGWRSLPRGFVGYSVSKEKFFIVGGKWLNDEIVENICKSFNIKDPLVMYFPDYDNIKWEDK